MSNKNNRNASVARRYRDLVKRFPDLQVYDAKKDFGFNLEHLSRGAANISSHLEMADYDTYFVGGVMRDIILGKDYNDIDICTSATPNQIKQLFKGRCQIIGRRFQLTHVAAGDKRYDVATFRVDREVSRDKLSNEQRKAADNGILMVDNAFSTDVGEDAKRRDFTINALFGKVLTNEILDFYNGIDHLINRRVVMIGDPDIRLREDPMRIIRAIRLSAKLNFTIDEDLRKNMFTHKNLLKFTSESRLSDEINKTLASGAAFKVIELFSEYDLNDITLPQFHAVVGEEIAGQVSFRAIKGFKPEFAKLIADQHSNLKRLLTELEIDPNLIKAYSPTLALTLAGALITDQRVAYDQPVNPAFLLATMRTVGFIEVFLRYYHNLIENPSRKADFAKEIETVLLSLAENSFSESCNKLNGRDKENTKTILCNLAVQFITPAGTDALRRMSEPMFRAAFSVFRIFVQLFSVDEQILANYRTWDKINQQYVEDTKRRRPVRRNPQGEIISSKRRREVPDFPYMDISDKEMHIRLAPAIVNIQQAIVLHNSYRFKRSAGLELLDLFIKKRREYYNLDQDQLEAELGQVKSIYFDKQQQEDLALLARKRFKIRHTLDEDLEDPVDFGDDEEDPERAKALRHQAAQKILKQTFDEDTPTDVNAIPFASDLDLYYDRAEFQTVYNADFDNSHEEDLKVTQEQTLGRITPYNREKLDQIFHEFDNDFYLHGLRPTRIPGGGWDTSKREAGLQRMYDMAPEISRHIINLYASEKVARASAREKARELGLDANLPYDQLIALLRDVEELQNKDREDAQRYAHEQSLIAQYNAQLAKLKEDPEANEVQIKDIEAKLEQLLPAQNPIVKSGHTYALDAYGNVLHRKVVSEDKIARLNYRKKQYHAELQRRYEINKNKNIVAELHAKGIFHLDDEYDTYDSGETIEEFFKRNRFTQEDIDFVTLSDYTAEDIYQKLEDAEQAYLQEQQYFNSVSDALVQADPEHKLASGKAKSLSTDELFAQLDASFAPQEEKKAEPAPAPAEPALAPQVPGQVNLDPALVQQLQANAQKALVAAVKESAEKLLDLETTQAPAKDPATKVQNAQAVQPVAEVTTAWGIGPAATSMPGFGVDFNQTVEPEVTTLAPEATSTPEIVAPVPQVAPVPAPEVAPAPEVVSTPEVAPAPEAPTLADFSMPVLDSSSEASPVEESPAEESSTEASSTEASSTEASPAEVKVVDENPELKLAQPGTVTDLSKARHFKDLITYYSAFAPGLLPKRVVLELVLNLLQLPGLTINEFKLLTRAIELPEVPVGVERDRGQQESFAIQIIPLLEQLIEHPSYAPKWIHLINTDADISNFLATIPESHEFASRIAATLDGYEKSFASLTVAFERLNPLVEKLNIKHIAQYLTDLKESAPEAKAAVESAKSSYDFLISFKKQHLTEVVYSQEQLDELEVSYTNFKACVEIGQTLQCMLQHQNRYLQEFWVVVEDNYPFGGPSHSINTIMQCINKLKAINSRNIGIVSKFIEYALTVLESQIAYAKFFTANIERKYYLQKSYAQHEINLAKKLYALTQQYPCSTDLGLPEDIPSLAEEIINEASVASKMLKDLKVKEIRRLHRELNEHETATKRVGKSLFIYDSQNKVKISITNINGILKEYQERVLSIKDHDGLFAKVANLFKDKPGQGEIFSVKASDIEPFALDLALRCELFDHCHISKSQRRRLTRLGLGANRFAHEGTPVNTLGISFTYLSPYPELTQYMHANLGVTPEQVAKLVDFNQVLLQLQLQQEQHIIADARTQELQGLSARAKAYALEYPEQAQLNRAHLEELSHRAVELDLEVGQHIDEDAFVAFTADRGSEVGLIENSTFLQDFGGEDDDEDNAFSRLGLALVSLGQDTPEEELAQAQAEAQVAQAEEQTEPKVEAKEETKAQAKEEPQAQAQAKEEPKAQAKEETQAPAKEEAKAPAKEESQAQVKEEPKAQAKEESKAQAKEESKAQAKEESKAQAKEESKAPAKEDSKAPAKEDSKAPAKAQAKEEPASEDSYLDEDGDEIPELPNVSYRSEQANRALSQTRKASTAAALTIVSALEGTHEPAAEPVKTTPEVLNSYVQQFKAGEPPRYADFSDKSAEERGQIINHLSSYVKQYTRVASQKVNSILKEHNALSQEATANKQKLKAVEPLLLNKQYLSREKANISPELKAEIDYLEAQTIYYKMAEEAFNAKLDVYNAKLARVKLDQSRANKIGEMVKALKQSNEANYVKFFKQYEKAVAQQAEIEAGLIQLNERANNLNNKTNKLQALVNESKAAYDKALAGTKQASKKASPEKVAKLQDSDIKFIKDFREGYNNRTRQVKLLEQKYEQIKTKAKKADKSYEVALQTASPKSSKAKQLKANLSSLEENLVAVETNLKGIRSNLERMENRFKTIVQQCQDSANLDKMSIGVVQEFISVCKLLSLTAPQGAKDKLANHVNKQAQKKAQAKAQEPKPAPSPEPTPEVVEAAPTKPGLLKRALSIFGFGKKK